MINYQLPPNLGICPKCKETNVFLERETGRAKCTGKDCGQVWPDEMRFIDAQTQMIRFRLQTGKKSMSKQDTVVTYGDNGEVILVQGGIEWVVKYLPGRKYRQGYTCNPLGGCLHGCQWVMPNGDIAVCYAKTVAERLAMAQYPQGFEALYWHPERLYDGLKVPESVRIFFDSMSDITGHWVDKGKVFCVLKAVEDIWQHDFLTLTKNPARLPQFNGYFPDNLWLGFSSPPDYWRNEHTGVSERLTRNQQERMLHKAFKSMAQLNVKIKWVSFEPLSWNVAPIVAQYPGVINWAVIGAASNGRELYQPEDRDVEALLEVLDAQKVKVFYKGNLAYQPGRYDFPV